MAKKRRKDKELARLRREVEVLKAQVAGREDKGRERVPKRRVEGRDKPQDKPRQLSTKSIIQQVDPKFLKKDLIKSGILALIVIGTLATLALLL
jgi:hypothetical protein